jgi:RNA polymerase sigma-70 factor, ECF subfamily
MHTSNRPASSDDALVRQARAGDPVAFEELVTRHTDRLCGALRRMGLGDAEVQEVAQDAFVRAWRGLRHFEGHSSFFTWLYRIAFNESQRRLSRGSGSGLISSSEALRVEEIEDEAPGPAARAETDELRRALQQALLALPIDLRAPVLLRDVEGLSIRRGAAVLDLGETVFKNRLHRGRIALRRLLEPLLSSEAED